MSTALNTGVMLVHNTPWSRRFFSEVARLGRLDDHHKGKNTLSKVSHAFFRADESPFGGKGSTSECSSRPYCRSKLIVLLKVSLSCCSCLSSPEYGVPSKQWFPSQSRPGQTTTHYFLSVRIDPADLAERASSRRIQ